MSVPYFIPIKPIILILITSRSLCFVVWEPRISVQNVVPIHLVDVKISEWINENSDLQTAVDEKLGIY